MSVYVFPVDAHRAQLEQYYCYSTTVSRGTLYIEGPDSLKALHQPPPSTRTELANNARPYSIPFYCYYGPLLPCPQNTESLMAENAAMRESFRFRFSIRQKLMYVATVPL